MAEEMKESPKILSVKVEARMAMSIQTADGDWLKPEVSIVSHVGPGYPDNAMMDTVIYNMMDKAKSHCAAQIEMMMDSAKAGVPNA